MHLSSIDKMKAFRKKYLTGKENEFLKICDLGSQAIGGSYRPVFEEPNWEYTGIDICEGENVDIVLSDPYSWLEIESESADVLVSGQVFEHVEYFWETMKEIARILKPGGLICIIAPSSGPEHKYPVDCWRFYPDGMRSLAKYAGLEPLEVYTQWEEEGYTDGSDEWADTVLIARKTGHSKKDNESASAIHIYKREAFFPQTEDSLTRLSAYIDQDSEILELGPATGYYTRYLAEEKNCRVDCVEISEIMAKEAERFCRKMVVADLDETELTAHFQQESYDAVVAADVLEHLKNPAHTLIHAQRLLKPEGKLLISVPNISHAAVIAGLIKGEFRYTEEGLLDRTHLRFFTRENLLELIRECGFFPLEIDTIRKLPEETEIMHSLTDLPVSVQKAIFDRPDALSYQFILVCQPGKGKKTNARPVEKEYATRNLNYVSDMRRLYLKTLQKRIQTAEDGLSIAEELAEERLTRLVDTEKGLLAAERLARERNMQISVLETALGDAQSFVDKSRKELNRLGAAYSSAEQIAHDRLLDIQKLDKALAQAENLFRESLNRENELKKGLDRAETLALERAKTIVALEEGLAQAQKLAYDRLDRINQLERDMATANAQLGAQFAEMESIRARLSEREEEVRTLRELLQFREAELNRIRSRFVFRAYMYCKRMLMHFFPNRDIRQITK